MIDYIIELPPIDEMLYRDKRVNLAMQPARPDIGMFKFFKLERHLFRRRRTGCYLLVTDNPEVAAIG